MSISEGFSLANGVRIFPIAPSVGARGEATYEDRFDEAFGDDLEEKGQAKSARTQKTWLIIESILNAYTGDPDHNIIFSLSGNRNNPEKESIFNRVIDRASKSKDYRVRSISVLKKDGTSNTIRMTDEEAREFAKTAGADGTDNPYDNMQDPVFDTTQLSYVPLSELQNKPAFRCAFFDLAFSKTNSSSYTGVVLLYITEDGKLHFGSYAFKAAGRELISKIVRIADEHKLNSMTVERMATVEIIPNWIEDEMARQGLTDTIVNDVVAPRLTSKENRIGNALAVFDPSTMSFISELRDPLIGQMMEFTPEKVKQNKGDWDVLDAWSYAVDWFQNNKQVLSFHPFRRPEPQPIPEISYSGLSV